MTVPGKDDIWSSTLTLLAKANAGDDRARDDLFARHIPELHRWATGRLPTWARDMADTQDVVQDTLAAMVRRMHGFEHRGPGAFRAYLRTAVMNRIRDHLRWKSRQPVRGTWDNSSRGQTDASPTPFESAVANQVQLRYEQALERLEETTRDLVIARVELQMTYAEIAAATGRPSADAVRMAVSRALATLAQEMHAVTTVD